jgi:hypothetical protein
LPCLSAVAFLLRELFVALRRTVLLTVDNLASFHGTSRKRRISRE